eukprot:3196315-Prorocentrum_lima.AAC.1
MGQSLTATAATPAAADDDTTKTWNLQSPYSLHASRVGKRGSGKTQTPRQPPSNQTSGNMVTFQCPPLQASDAASG